MRIPLRKRFRIDRMTSERGWCVRIMAGFPVLVIYWKCEEFYTSQRPNTGLGIGWIPMNTQEGSTIPFRRWVRGR